MIKSELNVKNVVVENDFEATIVLKNLISKH